MNKQWMSVLAACVLLPGCATVDRGAIPVVDSGAPVAEGSGRQVVRNGASPSASRQQAPAASASPSAGMGQDSGVVVMIPQGGSAPLQTFPAPSSPGVASPQLPGGVPATQGGWSAPSGSVPPSTPSGIPSSSSGNGALTPDEQLEGPVLALLTTAQQLQSGGDLNGAASSLERAQRIAPREPQVLYRLAQVRLEQGDAVQAEQLSRRALSYAVGRPALQASLWELIARSRERQGDAAGAAQARERARVTL